MAVFALLLELGVLGALSISHQLQPIPLGILRVARATNLPFFTLRDANDWLINLTTLGYFGLASSLSERRPDKRPQSGNVAAWQSGCRSFAHEWPVGVCFAPRWMVFFGHQAWGGLPSGG
jgi:hypothetical protein